MQSVDVITLQTSALVKTYFYSFSLFCSFIHLHYLIQSFAVAIQSVVKQSNTIRTIQNQRHWCCRKTDTTCDNNVRALVMTLFMFRALEIVGAIAIIIINLMESHAAALK